MERKIKRKDFLQKLFFTGLAVTGLSTFYFGCGENKNEPGNSKTSSEKPQEKNNDPCNNINDLTQQERQVREAYQYTGHSSNPDQLCSNCNYFQVPNPGETCGSCQVVKGPINPKGHCTVWTKKVS